MGEGNEVEFGAALRGEAPLRDLLVPWREEMVSAMSDLEGWARDRGAKRLILQTGDRQPEAVALFERAGYERIEIYEPYVTTFTFSRCFEKQLSRETP